MSVNVSTPWHKVSYGRFLNELLPQLLAQRLPLLSYSVEETGPFSCRIDVSIGTCSNTVEIGFDLPRPNDIGLFRIGENYRVVVPIATSQSLDKAEIKCVGEQMFEYIALRIGEASAELPWDMALVRAWLPLDTWISEFLNGLGDRFITAQSADMVNWLALHTHLRRLIIPDLDDVIAPGQLGYVCPFETPEGPNLGHILTVAVGAEIRDGRMVILDDNPPATLGISASMVPLLEHNDPNRQLMGVNMMRQWVPQLESEPALVQTGNEPDALLTPEFWTGRNLLTAFVSWGAGTYEDSIVISQSCAQRFDSPYPLQLGDKLSNRHGTKGVIGRILPDDEMPHLAHGTPVEIIFNYTPQTRRMNFGQIREAVLGRIANSTGDPVIAAPFTSPTSNELRQLCLQAGLPQSGMEILTMGKNGLELQHPSTVGNIYWGRLFHLAKNKLLTYVNAEQQWGQRIGEMETYMLRDLGAYENIRESLNVRAVRHPDASNLLVRVALGPISNNPPPTPLFTDLVSRLRLAGIVVTLEGEKVAFQFSEVDEKGLVLALPIAHPWLPERPLTEIDLSSAKEFSSSDPQLNPLISSIIEANERIARMLAGHTPKHLVEDAAAQLKDRVQTLFNKILTPAHLRIGDRVLFSGRGILTPGTGLSLEQLGLPDEMAWTLFESLVVRELGGDAHAVEVRSEAAVQALDGLMARSWVILNRAPTFEPTALLAFHPVRVAGDALQLQPLVCKWLNADFDGDQAAIYLPITHAAQCEAGNRLSVAAHLSRDPSLLSSLMPNHDMLWGLAYLSQTPQGLDEINQILGESVTAIAGFITRSALLEALHKVMTREGVKAVLSVLTLLMQRGFEAAKNTGASVSAFMGENLHIPSPPQNDDEDQWSMYLEMVIDVISSSGDFNAPEFGPQLLLIKASESLFQHLPRVISGYGPIRDALGQSVYVHHSYVEGLTPEEMYASVAGARRGISSLHHEWSRMGETSRSRNVSRSFNVLPRALRAKHPGMVFARAADKGEVDPLTDVESRLLVGLPVK